MNKNENSDIYKNEDIDIDRIEDDDMDKNEDLYWIRKRIGTQIRMKMMIWI